MNLRGRTSAIEKQLDQQQEPQTAILMPKKSDSEAIVTEIAYSHEQAGREWQRNLATVKRWAKDPSKWPTGWIYDGDRQFWVKTP
jgi:hypothetical protein